MFSPSAAQRFHVLIDWGLRVCMPALLDAIPGGGPRAAAAHLRRLPPFDAQTISNGGDEWSLAYRSLPPWAKERLAFQAIDAIARALDDPEKAEKQIGSAQYFALTFAEEAFDYASSRGWEDLATRAQASIEVLKRGHP